MTTEQQLVDKIADIIDGLVVRRAPAAARDEVEDGARAIIALMREAIKADATKYAYQTISIPLPEGYVTDPRGETLTQYFTTHTKED